MYIYVYIYIHTYIHIYIYIYYIYIQREIVSDHAEVLGAKYANMLLPQKHLDLSVYTQREYCIKPNNLNCRSSNVVYLFSCKACSKQYTGSTESFRSRFNNYKSAHRSFIKGNTVKQASFHAHFENDKHHGISDWEITLTDQTDSVEDLRRRESFQQYELDTFQPNGLNERDVALF